MKNFLSAVLISIFASIGCAQTLPVKIYLSNEKFDPEALDCGKVYPVTRNVPKTKAVARAALEELFKGVTPEEKAKGYWSFFDETKSVLRNVNFKNGAAYINFKSIVIEKLGNATTSCGGSAFDGQIETTLKQFKTIKKIFYAIEGKPADYYDWMQVGECPKELKNCDGSNFK